MRKAVHVAGPENETPAQLKRIFPQFLLRVPGGLSAGPGLGIVFAQQVEQVGVSEFQRLVGFAFFVDQQRKADSGLVAEGASIGAVAKPDRGKGSSPFSERLLIGAQLRDVFTAENSAVMAQEYDHCRLPQPQGTEANLPPLAVGQLDHRDSAVQGRVHASILAAARRLSREPANQLRTGQLFLGTMHPLALG